MRTVRLYELTPGDVVMRGPFAGPVGTVARVDPAVAKGYRVVTYTNGKSTSAHREALVEIQEMEYTITFNRAEPNGGAITLDLANFTDEAILEAQRDAERNGPLITDPRTGDPIFAIYSGDQIVAGG